MTVVTRFAPSPTGYLHVGGARTALYSWLYAKRHQGKYILRIEDTDRERSTDEAIQAIIDGLAWLGLTADAGPYYQTQHFARYNEVLQQWLAEGKAYRCYCSKERLEQLRDTQMANKEKPRYDGFCRHNAPVDVNASFVIRFKNPEQGCVEVHDLILGTVVFENVELDDLIIARSDGVPTYNFTVVVDDYDMKVTHVIRGNDHLNNTPRQINMLLALGYAPPLYAHLPMILGDDGKRLSKRHGAASVLQFREDGFLPQALLNYLVRLGWSHGDQEIFSIEEMIDFFDLKHINKAPCAFDRDKLLWLNHHYIKTLPVDVLVNELNWHIEKLGMNISDGPDLSYVVDAQRERCKTLREMALQSAYFYGESVSYDPAAAAKFLTEQTRQALMVTAEKLQDLVIWSHEDIKDAVHAVGEQLGLKLGQYGPAIRVALTGNTQSPALEVTIALIEQEKAVRRLRAAVAYITQP